MIHIRIVGAPAPPNPNDFPHDPNSMYGAQAIQSAERSHRHLMQHYPSERVFNTGFEWRDVPELAIVTGINGAGKTQLLQLIERGMRSPDSHRRIEIDIDGTVLRGFPDYQQAQQVLRYGSEWPDLMGQSPDPSGRTPVQPSDISIFQSQGAFGLWLSQLFSSFLEARAQAYLDAEKSRTAPPEPVDLPPWAVMNEAMTAAEIPYEVNHPTRLDERDSFRPVLRNKITGAALELNQLSSGERILASLGLLLYGHRAGVAFPKFLLLDEPDAHLHPTLARQLLDILSSIVVQRYGVRVILTTHSPSTVALAPENSVFLLTPPAPASSDVHKIERVGRERAIAELTAGFVSVGPSTRYVLVEGKDDPANYNMFWELLTRRDPETGDSALDKLPAIVFQPVSEKRQGADHGGGKSKVREVTLELQRGFHKFRLPSPFRGLLDGDNGNAEAPQLLVLQRYEIENYLLDPLVIYAILNEAGKAPPVSGVLIEPGEEYRIRTLSTPHLQRIADTVLAPVAGQLSLQPAERNSEQVEYLNGEVLTLPRWLLHRKGSKLIPTFNECYPNGPKRLFGYDSLQAYHRRINLLPKELLRTFQALQM